MPALEPLIFYYIRVCEHVLAIPLTEEEVQYEAKLVMRFYRVSSSFVGEMAENAKGCGSFATTLKTIDIG